MALGDHYLRSYTVDAEARTISFVAVYKDASPYDVADATFRGVEGYHFERDNLGTILLDVRELPLDEFIATEREALEAGRVFAWPDLWNRDDATLATFVRENSGLRAYYLESAVGMEGWVLAERFDVRYRDAVI